MTIQKLIAPLAVVVGAAIIYGVVYLTSMGSEPLTSTLEPEVARSAASEAMPAAGLSWTPQSNMPEQRHDSAGNAASPKALVAALSPAPTTWPEPLNAAPESEPYPRALRDAEINAEHEAEIEAHNRVAENYDPPARVALSDDEVLRAAEEDMAEAEAETHLLREQSVYSAAEYSYGPRGNADPR